MVIFDIGRYRAGCKMRSDLDISKYITGVRCVVISTELGEEAQ